jgi:hypothetical protein
MEEAYDVDDDVKLAPSTISPAPDSAAPPGGAESAEESGSEAGTDSDSDSDSDSTSENDDSEKVKKCSKKHTHVLDTVNVLNNGIMFAA